jgi:glutamate synthase (NADPH/NADH) small chain
MAKDVKGFLKIKRQASIYRPVCERVKDNKEVLVIKEESQTKDQARRCMDCGTPFCHYGCPLGNIIPEWNELTAGGNWNEAFKLLNSTNILPEVTGRICPALCESACVLGINDDAVTVRDNELSIIEKAFTDGFIKADPPLFRTGKKVAVIGSGPAGLSAASFLNKKGHSVVVFERDKKAGGILRYGIPDFKLEKSILDRRIKILEEEGIEFKTGVNVENIDALKKDFDAVCLAIGSKVPRDLNIPGRELKGIHFAMDFLVQANKRVANENIDEEEIIAKDKKVIVIGGGDTGADCIGISNRQGAVCVSQIEIMPKPPTQRTEDMPWPKYPLILRTSSSHQEGGEREWCVLTKEFLSDNDNVKGIKCERVEFGPDKDINGRPIMKVLPNTEFEIEADLVVLAMGFVHPEHEGLLESVNIDTNERGNIKADENKWKTNVDGVFACGDARRGQSLIVWALYEGKMAADSIDEYLK